MDRMAESNWTVRRRYQHRNRHNRRPRAKALLWQRYKKRSQPFEQRSPAYRLSWPISRIRLTIRGNRLAASRPVEKHEWVAI